MESSSRSSGPAHEEYRQWMVQFDDRIYFAALPLPLPSPSSLNAPTSSSSSSSAHRTPLQTSSPPPSDADSSGSDVEFELDSERMEGTQRQGSKGKGKGRAERWEWFTVDEELTYLSFADDFGPLNLEKVFTFCIALHGKLDKEENKDVNFVLYTSVDPKAKANAALLMALYVLIVGRKMPWEAFQPIAEVEFRPFRDAGRCEMDYGLSIQDCLYGMYKALDCGLIDLSTFDPDEYAFYERVENGDFNWVAKDFIAFASPHDNAFVRALNTGTVDELGSGRGLRKRSKGYQMLLDYFEKNGVGLVVRLNNPLYDKRDFESRGIEFKDMFFEDGTNPPKEMVREFLRDADRIIESQGVVAIHCKAGLGRTGCLIAAHLVYKYGFTAGEVMGFMRICRPGMVVGPQQQYIHNNHLEWVKWAAADEAVASYKASFAASEAHAGGLRPTRMRAMGRPVTPPAEDKRDPMSTPARRVALPSVTPGRHATAADGMVPVPQPRKTPLAKRTVSTREEEEDDSSSDLDDDPLGRLPGHTSKYRKSTQNERVEVEAMLYSPTSVPTVLLTADAQPRPPPTSTRISRPAPLSSPAKRPSGTSFGTESTSTASNPTPSTVGRARTALPVSTRKVGPQTESRIGRLGGLRSLTSPTPKNVSPLSRLPTLSGLPIRTGVRRLFGSPKAGVGKTGLLGKGTAAVLGEGASGSGPRLDSGRRILRKRRSSLSIADFVG